MQRASSIRTDSVPMAIRNIIRLDPVHSHTSAGCNPLLGRDVLQVLYHTLSIKHTSQDKDLGLQSQ